MLAGIEKFKFFLIDPKHAGQVHRAAGIERRLHRKRLQQAVVGEDAAHFFGALQIGFVLFEQFLDFLPARQRLLLVVKHHDAAGFDNMLLFDADQALGLFDVVERDARHAERIAPHVGRHIHTRRPALTLHKQILFGLQPKHGHGRKTAAFVTGRKHQRKITMRNVELGIAHRNRIEFLRKRRQRPRCGQRDLVILQKRGDFLVAKRRADLHVLYFRLHQWCISGSLRFGTQVVRRIRWFAVIHTVILSGSP